MLICQDDQIAKLTSESGAGAASSAALEEKLRATEAARDAAQAQAQDATSLREQLHRALEDSKATCVVLQDMRSQTQTAATTVEGLRGDLAAAAVRREELAAALAEALAARDALQSKLRSAETTCQAHRSQVESCAAALATAERLQQDLQNSTAREAELGDQLAKVQARLGDVEALVSELLTAPPQNEKVTLDPSRHNLNEFRMCAKCAGVEGRRRRKPRRAREQRVARLCCS